MHIIAVNGFKRSGKGATANAIEANILVGRVKQVGFADKVKIFGARALGFLDASEEECIKLMDIAKENWVLAAVSEHEDGELPRFQMSPITGRQYLQNVGTEARKLFGDDFWVDQVLPKPAPRGPNPDGYHKVVNDHNLKFMHGVDWLLITDLRFENEAQRVLDLGGEVWRVTRPGTESDGHDSEQVLPDKFVTREIENDDTLEALEQQVVIALGDLEAGVR